MSGGGRRRPPIGPRFLINSHHHDSGSGSSSSAENRKRDGDAQDYGHHNMDRDNKYASSSSYSSSKIVSMNVVPYNIQTRQASQTRGTTTRAHPRTTRVLQRKMHQSSSATTDVSSCTPPVFSAIFSDAVFSSAPHSRHQHWQHTANSMRTTISS